MPDIRSFFTPKGGSQGANTKSAPKPSSPLPVRTKRSAKKRVVEDSEDEDEAPPQKKTISKKSTVKVEPEEEKVDSSTYFASTKSKINRSAPVRTSKVIVKKEDPEPDYLDDEEEDKMDDIFKEEYGKLKDDYVEPHPIKKELKKEDEDVDMEDVKEDKEEEDAKRKKGSAKKTVSTRGKRRMSASEEEYLEEDDEAPKKRRHIAESKPPAKKRAPAKKAEAEPDNSEARKILDNVQTVRPPTPPPQDPDKKWNYKGFHARQAAAPIASGTKEIPEGAENCLAGLTFVFTGLLESISREEGQQLVKRYGGKVTTSPSRKTSFVVLGSDAGPKKLQIIRDYNLKTINEDGLFELIRKLPPNGGDSTQAVKMAEKRQQEEKKVMDMVKEMEQKEKAEQKTTDDKKAAEAQLWTVKYAPTSMGQICGNKGQVEKLQNWLKNWESNRKVSFKKRGADGSGAHRGVMISGPPGIGKTTAAHLVAKLEGYDVVEYNASDTRSKKLIEETLRGVLDNRSLAGYFAAGGKEVDAKKKKMLLIMDEVDGMSAGDRGGVGQLVQVCKKSNIPVICICNERRLPKMRPFDGVTFELQFRRPDAQAIRARIASIAFREGLKLPANVIDSLVEGTGSDIRQIINMLSTFNVNKTGTMSFDESKNLSKAWEKHVILKPWDITGQLLGPHLFVPNSKKTLNEKLELYFNDHEFAPLMIQENYLKAKPTRAARYQGREKNLKELELFDMAAESISDGDLVDALIHGPQQQWSLMPTHGILSTVKPSSYVYGNIGHQISFTSWLGNNSKAGKLARYVKEIQSHMRLRAHGDRHEIRQQYLPTLWRLLPQRLEMHGKDVINDCIELMDDYFLTKEDYDAIIELGVGPMSEEVLNIPTQVKTAFTRTYNQASHPMPFMKSSNVLPTAKVKKDAPDLEDAIVESEDETLEEIDGKDEEAEEEDITKDKYIKQAKTKTAAAKGKDAKTAAKKTAAAKGKGKAKK